MAMVDADWSVDRATGNIRYIGDDHGGASPSYATVIEFHRWLQDKADDAVSSGDDELDITDTDPSARSTDNIIALKGTYNIDDATSEHLYDGSVKQGTGVTETIYAGFVNFGNVETIQIIQNGAVLTDDWWNQILVTAGPRSEAGISHRFMLKVRTGGANVDNRKVIGISRRFGYTYSEFTVNFAGEGNNVLALSEVSDLNNQTAEGTVAAYSITNTTEGYNLIDVDNNGTPETYYAEWDANTPTNSINDLYEYSKYLTREGSASTLYGLNGELFRGITHEIAISSPSGTFVEPELVTWTGGSGQLLAIDSTTAGTKMWIQLLTGVIPATQTLTGAGGGTATSGTVTSRPLSFPFIGASTGSALIGGYGVGVETNDLTNNDTLFDLTNTSINPPNNVTFAVGGLVSGEDRVLVAPWDGTTTDSNGDPAIQQDQLSIATALTIDNVTSVVVAETIPSDTPSTGTIRVVDNNGFDRRLEYSSYTGSTFTISSTDGQEDFATVNASIGNDVYITYIDKLATAATASFTAVYSSDRDLVVVVRDGGVSPIKQFISSATFGSSNTTVTAIRTSDL